MIMKYERILDNLLLGSAAFCSLGVGLFFDPLPASAVEIGVGGEAQIEEYLDTAGENLGALDFQFNSDQDGNRNIRVKIFGLQQLAFTAQSGFYGGLDFSAAPDTTTVSGSGVSGLYSYNDELKSGIISLPDSNRSGSFTFFSSPDMTLTLVPSNTSNVWTASSTSGSATWSIGFGVLQAASDISLVSSNTSLQSDFVVPSRVAASVRFRSPLAQNTPPTWAPGSFVADGNGSLPSQALIGLGEDLTLPSGTVDTSRPWDYYNNVLLPYMEQEFPGFDQYFVFPDGYFPQDSTEPITIPFLEPTSPNWDIVGGEIGTNPPGADDAVYVVSDPDQLGLPLPDPGFDKIQFSLSAFGDSIAFWFAFLGRVCDSLHITPVLTIALCLGAVGFILWKVGS